jgi:UDP-N-acetyl-2-amino-2-deoxyglucuronate dehydrogenase
MKKAQKSAKNFAVIGVAGYIAPRHLQAIRSTGNRLIAAVDPHDSVGILDKYFLDVAYFKEFERFDHHIEKLRRGSGKECAQYVTICSPNYLHDAHIRFALRVGADAICEKPLVLNPWNCDGLKEIEQETGRKVNTVLQLRLHPAVKALKEKFAATKKKHEVNLTYVTSRGKWYLYSWKGSLEQSGGLVTNIGIHFFDMLLWVFGDVIHNEVHVSEPTRTSGYLELKHAKVRWKLSINRDDLPAECLKQGQPTFRSITVDGEDVEFSEGFTDLHTRVYEEILAGRGFGIDDARPSIQLVHDIRRALPAWERDR